MPSPHQSNAVTTDYRLSTTDCSLTTDYRLSMVLLLAFLIGAVSGLRSLTAPAVVAWGAHLRRLALASMPLAFVASRVAVIVLTLLALVELVMDKLPTTPSRLKPGPFGGRLVLGALSGAALGVSGAQALALGAIVGAAGAAAGAFVGYRARTRLVAALRIPDLIVALCEDAVAVLGAILIVTRF